MQGCSLRCPDCISSTLWPKDGGRKIHILELTQNINLVKHYFDGLTITGGEPFDQYESLVAFCALVKKMTNLSIYCFSGYTLYELLLQHPDQLFMRHLDYLMDGRYLKNVHENGNTRGSSNQNLYRFKDGQAALTKASFSADRWSVAVTNENKIFMTRYSKERRAKKN